MITNAEMAMATTTSSGKLCLYTGANVKAVTIDNSQNVGIGTTSPSTKLDVVGTKGSDGIITVTDEASVAAGVGGEIDFRGIYQGTTKTSIRKHRSKENNATAGITELAWLYRQESMVVAALPKD